MNAVNHPGHYKGPAGLEAIDVIKEFTEGLSGVDAFCAGNAIKYILRWNNKNGTEDLEKAKWYINKLIESRKVVLRDVDFDFGREVEKYAYTE